MAIFVAFAWMIEAAEYLGLIETEAQDPQSRAYRLAHQGLAMVKTELSGVRLERLDEQRVQKLSGGSPSIIASIDGEVVRQQAGVSETLLELGPNGGVSFFVYGDGIEVKILACTEDGGSHELHLVLPPVPPPEPEPPPPQDEPAKGDPAKE